MRSDPITFKRQTAARIVSSFGSLALAIGAIAAVTGVAYEVWYRSRLATMVPAEGIVVRLVARPIDRGVRHPEFEFKVAGGALHSVVADYGMEPPATNVGDRVRILYDPKVPGSAVIDDFHSRWLFQMLCGIFSGVWIVVGLCARKFGPRLVRRLPTAGSAELTVPW
jgi:Protein of unknown function (DUF3592)